MELLPIKHHLSNKVENDWVLANLYDEVGMKQKAVGLKKNCVINVCKENNIPIIEGHYTRYCGIQNWEKLNWDVQTLSECKLDVPIMLLERMVKIKDKNRLYIAFPEQRSVTDPVLLYMLPYLKDCSYIELARWE